MNRIDMEMSIQSREPEQRERQKVEGCSRIAEQCVATAVDDTK